MHSTVICAGPSLKSTWKHVKNGSIFAVNRAINHPEIRADWMVCADPDPLRQAKNTPKQGFYINPADAALVPPAFPWRSIYDATEDEHRTPLNWSLQFALLLAARECSDVFLLGCDWSGLEEFDGPNQHGLRTDDRWAREARDVRATCRYLAAKGTTVWRGLPSPVIATPASTAACCINWSTL